MLRKRLELFGSGDRDPDWGRCSSAIYGQERLRSIGLCNRAGRFLDSGAKQPSFRTEHVFRFRTIDARDYSGSLVSVVIAYAFLEQAVAEGHRGIVVTTGRSASGRAMAVLARRCNMPILIIVRSTASKPEMLRNGVPHVLASDDLDFMQTFEHTARTLSMTAVFDGVGGAFISQMIAALPLRSSIYFYGFLSGAEKIQQFRKSNCS